MGGSRARAIAVAVSALAGRVGVARAAEPPAGQVTASGGDDKLSCWQVDSSLTGQQSSLRGTDASGKEGDSELGVTSFLDPLVDDGTPRSLQPFLQRASR